jgi:hypothetical protein
VCRVGSRVGSRDEPSKLTIKIFKCMSQERPISEKKEKKKTLIKASFTISNCYETIKNASILIKLGTNVGWTIACGTPCSI